MKTVYPRDVEGRKLSKVYLCDQAWKALPTQSKAPPGRMLFNFEVQAGRGKTARTFLVLDNYGDETIPSEMFEKLLRMKMFHFNLAIDKASGQLFTAAFVKEGREVSMTLAEMTFTRFTETKGIQLPKKLLPRLNELKSKKRPYFLTVYEPALWGFTVQESSLEDLRQSLVVDFHFDRRRVQLWNDSYREVTGWQ